MNVDHKYESFYPFGTIGNHTQIGYETISKMAHMNFTIEKVTTTKMIARSFNTCTQVFTSAFDHYLTMWYFAKVYM